MVAFIIFNIRRLYYFIYFNFIILKYIMDYFEAAKKLVIDQFSNIAVFVGLVMLVANTIEINNARKANDSKDPLNQAYSLNVASLVFLSLFVANHYIVPYIKTQ